MWALEWSVRILLSSLFLWDAVGRYVLHWAASVDLVRAVGLPMPELLTAVLGSVEIVGAVALLVPAAEALAATLLALYCLVVVALLHPSFTVGGVLLPKHIPTAAKDLALAGGLVAVALRDRRP